MCSDYKDSVRFAKVGIQSINFLNKFPDDTRLVDVQKRLVSIWKTLKTNTKKRLTKKYKNLRFYINGRRDPPLIFVRELQKTTKNIDLNFNFEKIFSETRVRFGHGGNAATAKLPITLTAELAYLVGAMRDGTLARAGKYEISYSQKDIRWLKIIQDLLIKVFKPSNQPVIRNDRVTLSNRPIFEYLHRIFDIPIGKKDLWGTPEIIKKSSLKLQRYYIRGFYDADGLSWKLGFCQANKEAISFVKDTLERLGIKTGKLSVRKREGRKPFYSFNTSTKSHVHFIKLIGSLNPSKQKLFLST